MLRRVFPLVRCASQARAASAICSKLPPKFIAPALARTKMNHQQGPQAVTGHLDKYGMGLDRKTPTSAEIEAELYEVLCNFKDYKIDRESVSCVSGVKFNIDHISRKFYCKSSTHNNLVKVVCL